MNTKYFINYHNLKNNDIEKIQLNNPKSKFESIDKLILSYLLVPQRQFQEYTSNYWLTYKLFYTWVVDPEIYDLVYDIGQYLRLCVQNDDYLRQTINLLDVTFDRRNYQVVIKYQLKENKEEHILTLKLRDTITNR